MRRYGDRPKSGQRYTRRPGAYAVVRRGNAALMTIEANQFGTDIQIPGGGIDPGEHPVAALHREVMEETGWRVAIERRLGTYQRYCYMPEYDLWAHKICNVFLCSPVRQISAPLEATHTAFWAPLSDIADLITNDADSGFIRTRLHMLHRRLGQRI